MTALTIVDPDRGTPALARMQTLLARPVVRRAAPLVALAALLAAALLGFNALTAAPSRDLLPGIGEADKAAVAQALDAGAIAYRIDSASGTLKVSGDVYHQARMLLAAQGLPKSAPVDDAASAVPMGASEAVERDHLQTAHEADLAHTIETIDAVAAARVHLAVEAPSLFVRDRQPPRASVMLTMTGGHRLNDGQVAAIGNLIASSVPGLAAGDVAIVDQAGRLLSTPDDASAALVGQLGVQRRVEERYRDALATVLTPLVGADGFTAQVHADLDFSATEATREGYPDNARALRAEDQKWTRDGAGAPPAFGIPGTLSNTPPPATTLSVTPPAATTASGSAPAGTTSQDISRRFELGREVSVTRSAPGTVRRLSLAVAIRELPGKRRGGVELQAIEALVRGAVGADAARGDVVAVSARPFVAELPMVASWWQAPWLVPALRYAAMALTLALGWWLVGRRLLKRYDATTRALRQDETQSLLGEALGARASDSGAPVTLDMIEAAPGYADRAALVRDYVRQDPGRAAQVLKAMIAGAATTGG